ncbi:MAG: hypothetical protein OHK0037_15610 [Elainellaceae cyanobacterium]
MKGPNLQIQTPEVPMAKRCLWTDQGETPAGDRPPDPLAGRAAANRPRPKPEPAQAQPLTAKLWDARATAFGYESSDGFEKTERAKA